MIRQQKSSVYPKTQKRHPATVAPVAPPYAHIGWRQKSSVYAKTPHTPPTLGGGGGVTVKQTVDLKIHIFILKITKTHKLRLHLLKAILSNSKHFLNIILIMIEKKREGFQKQEWVDLMEKSVRNTILYITCHIDSIFFVIRIETFASVWALFKKQSKTLCFCAWFNRSKIHFGVYSWWILFDFEWRFVRPKTRQLRLQILRNKQNWCS